MKITTNQIIHLSLLVVIGILLCLRQCDKPVSNTPDPYNYKTDTEYVDKPFYIDKPYPVKTPPREVVINTPAPPPERFEVEVVPDSLILLINDLRVQLNNAFLYQYPNNPKLVQLDLSQDTMSLSILQVDGTVHTNDYPLFLQQFKYRWAEGSMTHTPVKLKQSKPKLDYRGLYAYGGYDVLRKLPQVGMIYELNFWKLSIGASSIVTIEKQPQLNLWLNSRVRLLK